MNYVYKPCDYSDVGQTYSFLKEYKNIIRYSPATGYLYYTGTVWIESELKVQKLVQQYTDLQLKEACSALKEANDKENTAAVNNDDFGKKAAKEEAKTALKYRNFILKMRDTLKINAVIREAKPLIEIAASQLDADPYLLNTPDGIVNLKTKEIHPHKYDDYCTKITGVGISPDGAEIFSEFLKVITCGDQELEKYLQTIAGMFALGKVEDEALVIAYGSGRNGKSTFFNLLSKVLGNYSGNLSAETLTVNSRKNKSPEYAELRGKRLVIAAELQEGMRLDTAIVKKLCSTDEIYAEKKYKDPFAFTPSHTIVLYTNHLPDVGTSDDGTWRRLIVIPFNAEIKKTDDIKNYADYLFNNAGGAALSWIIEGALKYIQSDYRINIPGIVEETIENYRISNDWLNNYLSENCEIDKGYTQPSGELYSHYRDYCKQYGEYTRKQADFNAALKKNGFRYHKSNQTRNWIGLRLKKSETGYHIPQVSLSSTLPQICHQEDCVAGGGNDSQNYDDCENIEF